MKLSVYSEIRKNQYVCTTNLIVMNSNIHQVLKNWIPYKFVTLNDATYCRWLYLGDTPFTAPFFDETISACRSLPQNSKMLSSLSSADVLPGWAAQAECISPSAIIFHISRCGSTLVSQLLALQQTSIVLSEVPFFDALLRRGKKDPAFDSSAMLKAAVQLYGARRKGLEQNLFIKADSWHIHFYSELRQLYPEVPFILLYRRPDEVLRSQQKNRGMQAVPGVLEPEIFGFDRDVLTITNLDEYMVKVIESYLQAFAEILKTDQFALPVNYNEGAMAIVKKIAAVTGLDITEADMASMQQRAGFHAKYPGQFFAEPAMQEPIPAYLEKAFELYQEVENVRTATKSL
jgi:hypothetical protein